ncbi:MAG: LysR substrate-binding domain-containing protein [Pseudomonadota bacterium]
MNWASIPSLSALRAFEAAARLGSYSGAAKELNVTHAAVAQHVRSLEEFYGISLLFRAGRKMEVTAEGAELGNALGKAFKQIEGANDRLLRRSENAPLRVATTASFATFWLMPRIGLFWQEHPEIELEILPSDKVIDLFDEDVDIAIRYGKGKWPGLVSKPLIKAGYVAVAHPDYDASGSLLDHKLFTYGTINQEAVKWIQAQGLDLTEDKLTFVHEVQLARQAALSKRGIAILTRPVVLDDIAQGRLVNVSEHANEEFAYHILIKPNVVNPKRDVFQKWLLKEQGR